MSSGLSGIFYMWRGLTFDRIPPSEQETGLDELGVGEASSRHVGFHLRKRSPCIPRLPSAAGSPAAAGRGPPAPRHGRDLGEGRQAGVPRDLARRSPITPTVASSLVDRIFLKIIVLKEAAMCVCLRDRERENPSPDGKGRMGSSQSP